MRSFRVRRIDGSGSHVRGGDAIRGLGAAPEPEFTVAEHPARGGSVPRPPQWQLPPRRRREDDERRRRDRRDERRERRREREEEPVLVTTGSEAATVSAAAVKAPSAVDRRRWAEEEWLLLGEAGPIG